MLSRAVLVSLIGIMFPFVPSLLPGSTVVLSGPISYKLILNRLHESHTADLTIQVLVLMCFIWVPELQVTCSLCVLMHSKSYSKVSCCEFLLPQRIVLMIPNSIIVHLLPWEFGSGFYVPRDGVQGPSASVFGRRNKLHSYLQKLLTPLFAVFVSW